MDDADELRLTPAQALAFSQSRLRELESLPATVNPHAKREGEMLRAFHEKKVRELTAQLTAPAQIDQSAAH